MIHPKIHAVGREGLRAWGLQKVLDGRDSEGTMRGQCGLRVSSALARGLRQGILELGHVHKG